MSKNRLTILQALNITWIAQTSGKFIPTGNITGEFIRFYLAKKSGQRFVDSSSTVVADLVVATFALFIVGLFSLICILEIDNDVVGNYNFFYLLFSLLVIMISCLIFFIIIRKRIVKTFLKKSSKLFKFSLKKPNIINLIRLDYSLYKLSYKKRNFSNH